MNSLCIVAGAFCASPVLTYYKRVFGKRKGVDGRGMGGGGVANVAKPK